MFRGEKNLHPGLLSLNQALLLTHSSSVLRAEDFETHRPQISTGLFPVPCDSSCLKRPTVRGKAGHTTQALSREKGGILKGRK